MPAEEVCCCLPACSSCFCGSQILRKYQGQQCSIGMQAYQLQQKGATILDMCAHILTSLPTALRLPHEGVF